MSIFILTEGGKSIGWGHITRCLSLYQAFLESHHKPCLVINGDKSIAPLLKKRNYLIFNWTEEQNKLWNLIKDADCIIVDSYLASSKLYQRMAEDAKLLVCIDDNKRIDYPKGLVINHAINAHKLNYPHKADIRYLMGNQYVMIRKEFWKVPKKIINKQVKEILITFGGEDLRNLTAKTLIFLNKNFPKILKKIIIGPSFKNISEIKKVADSQTKLVFSASAQEMKSLMLKSDIAISAAGQSLFELSSVGVPTITVVVAANQVNHVKGWHEKGFIINAGFWNNPRLFDNIKNGLFLLKNWRERNKRSKIGRFLVDGAGSRRIVKIILKILSK